MSSLSSWENPNEIRCIEVQTFPMRNPQHMTVAGYDSDLSRARHLSNPRALSFHEVLWADGAPPVQKLTPEWQETKEARFRVTDAEAYDTQMRQLLGLD